MPIPGVDLTVADPGLGLVDSIPDAFLVLGTASLGTDNSLQTFSRKSDVVTHFGQGPLPEAMCKILDIAGGPVRGMRLTKTVAAVIGAVTATRVSTSTGTITVAATQKDVARAWNIDDPAGTPVFVEETADLNSATAADVTPWPATELAGDQFAIGFAQPFNQLSITISTSGVGGTLLWKFWNGTTWTTVTGLSDLTIGLTAAPGTYTVTFTMPTTWAKRSLNSTEQLYYLVAEVATVYATNPILSRGRILGHGAHDDYEAQIEITKTGTLGSGVFRYSLDDGRSFSGDLVIPSGGTFDLPFADLTVTFVAGAGPIFFEDGDLHEFDVNAPYYSATEIATAVTALLLQSAEFPAVLLTGTPASAAGGATIFAAVDAHATSFENVNRYLRWILDVGEDTTANVLTSFASLSSRRINPVYGTVDAPSAKPFTGYNFPKRSAAEIVAGWAADKLISTSLNRVLDGPLPGVLEISHDENLTELLDAIRITTTRSYFSRAGFFLTHGRLKGPTASDFRFWHLGRVMDAACRRTFIETQNFIGISVRTKSDGTIDERDAIRLESILNEALAEELLRPSNAEGTQGHASAARATVDRTNNVNTTSRINIEVAIRPLGYSFDVVVTIGYSLEAEEAA